MSHLRKGGLCPECEKGKLGSTKKDIRFTYKGKTRLFKNKKLFKCTVCNYEALSEDDTRTVNKMLTDFRRSVDGLLTSDQLEKIRKSLGRNKKQMAKLLSVNEKTIGRYENGIITQSPQADKLYRVLGTYPKAVRIIDPDQPLIDVKTIESTYKPGEYFGPKYNLKADDYFIFEESEHNVKAA